MKDGKKIIGVLLAAGRGRRMGNTKQLLPWHSSEGDKPLIVAAFDAVAPMCDEMIVVLGHEAKAVAEVLGDREFHTVAGNADAEMFESIRAGLTEAHRMDPEADLLVHPGDHPKVSPETLEALFKAHRERPGRAVLPVYDGLGGHPVFVPCTLVPKLLDYHGEGGLRQYWLDKPDDCVRMAIDDPSVVYDLDTPADYRDAQEIPGLV